MVRDRQASYNGQTLVPHSECGAHRLSKRDVEGVKVQGVQSVIESKGTVVIVQQNPDPPQVRSRLNRDFLAVVPNHPGVVAAAKHPGGRVLPNPLMLWC